MGSRRSPATSFAGLLVLPFQVLAFACGTLGSFVIWRVRSMRSEGMRHVPFRLHFPGNADSSVGEASLACVLGLLALALPLSLVLHG